MKKLLLILILMFGFLITPMESKAQVDYPIDNYISWTKVGTDGYDYCSWFYCVTRSRYPNSYGYYWYDVWFTSNSYTYDYYTGQAVWRYVQIDNCKVYFSGTPSNNGSSISFSFINNYTPNALRFKSKSLRPLFKIYWGNYFKL
jgi:hypothetical protein